MLILAAISLMVGLSMVAYNIVCANKIRHFIVFGIIELAFTIVLPVILLCTINC